MLHTGELVWILLSTHHRVYFAFQHQSLFSYITVRIQVCLIWIQPHQLGHICKTMLVSRFREVEMLHTSVIPTVTHLFLILFINIWPLIVENDEFSLDKELSTCIYIHSLLSFWLCKQVLSWNFPLPVSIYTRETVNLGREETHKRTFNSLLIQRQRVYFTPFISLYSRLCALRHI